MSQIASGDPSDAGVAVGSEGSLTAAPAPYVRLIGHLIGDPAAARRLVVYGTFECLHCRRAWPALRTLADDPTAGVAVEWRHFAPGGAFPNAIGAALAAEAAGEQERRRGPRSGEHAHDGAYWALHEALMAAPSPLWPERVDGIAAALGLDVARLRADAASAPVRAALAAQRAAAVADGVRGTPTAFVAGVRLDLDDLDTLGAQLYAR